MKKLIIILMLVSSEANALMLGGHGTKRTPEENAEILFHLGHAFGWAFVISIFLLSALLIEKLIIKVKSK